MGEDGIGGFERWNRYTVPLFRVSPHKGTFISDRLACVRLNWAGSRGYTPANFPGIGPAIASIILTASRPVERSGTVPWEKTPLIGGGGVAEMGRMVEFDTDLTAGFERESGGPSTRPNSTPTAGVLPSRWNPSVCVVPLPPSAPPHRSQNRDCMAAAAALSCRR